MGGFVKIVNGEVITDPNDPRLTRSTPASSTASMYPSSSSSSSSSSQRGGGGRGRGGASSFGGVGAQGPGASRQGGSNDGNLFGMPDFTLFDVSLKPQQYIIAILLCMFGGGIGLAFVLILFFTYRYYVKSVRGAPARRTGIRGTLDGFLESIFGGGGAPPPGQGPAPGGWRGNNDGFRPYGGGGFGSL